MMVGAHFCFSLMIAIIKAAQHLQQKRNLDAGLSSSFGTWESVLFRSLPMTFICLFVLLRRKSAGKNHPKLQPAEWQWLVTRGVIGAISMACFFYGTLHIPIAIASLFANSSVFLIGILGHVFLAERLTAKRVFFAVAGFAGVVLVLSTGFLPNHQSLAADAGPAGSAVNPIDFLIAFLSGVLSAVAYFSVRKMKSVPGNTIILSLSLSGVLLALFAGIFISPLRIPSDPTVLALLCLSGIPAIFAQYLMTWAFQTAEAGFVSLGQFTGPVFAALLGFVAFGESLSALQWLGAAVTICFGVMMPLFSEQNVQQKIYSLPQGFVSAVKERLRTK
ncbi:MAG: hypothetical protein RI953_2927 [Pseudomonadota bacterium]|jgi:drug/metabolite transporter (DMT)-like permease